MKTRLLTYLFFIILIFKYDYILSQNPKFITDPTTDQTEITIPIGSTHPYKYIIKAIDDKDLMNLDYSFGTNKPDWANLELITRETEVFRPDSFLKPRGIAINNIGTMYISDIGNNTILERKVTGVDNQGIPTVEIRTLNLGDIELNRPMGLALYTAIGSSTEFLYISDSLNDRIIKVDLSNDDASIYKKMEEDTRPEDLQVSSIGDIYVSSKRGYDIKKIKSNLTKTVTQLHYAAIHITSMVLDENNDFIYYTSYNTGVFRAPMSVAGSDPEKVFDNVSSQSRTYGIELDETGNLFISYSDYAPNPFRLITFNVTEENLPVKEGTFPIDNTTERILVDANNGDALYHMAIDKSNGNLVIPNGDGSVITSSIVARMFGDISYSEEKKYDVDLIAIDTDGHIGSQPFTIYVNEKPPKIVSSEPVSGTTGVDTNGIIKITFDKEIQIGSEGKIIKILKNNTRENALLNNNFNSIGIRNNRDAVSIKGKILTIDISKITNYKIKENTEVFFEIEKGFVEGIRGAQFERSTLNSPNYIHFTTKQNITNFKNIEKTYGPDLEIPLKP
ncbi:MAG: Ig-like domain-containing protein, partial [Flavobacteriaceae bacterium]|nr:Ig-like domain-containing protein [Flavobacteriaceae bacterium]